MFPPARESLSGLYHTLFPPPIHPNFCSISSTLAFEILSFFTGKGGMRRTLTVIISSLAPLRLFNRNTHSDPWEPASFSLTCCSDESLKDTPSTVEIISPTRICRVAAAPPEPLIPVISISPVFVSLRIPIPSPKPAAPGAGAGAINFLSINNSFITPAAEPLSHNRTNISYFLSNSPSVPASNDLTTTALFAAALAIANLSTGSILGKVVAAATPSIKFTFFAPNSAFKSSSSISRSQICCGSPPSTSFL